MPSLDPDDALAAVTDAARSIDASTRQMATTLEALRQDFRGLRWLQGLTIALLGVSLLGIGGLLWYSSTQHAQIAQMVRQNTQTIDAQTRALLEGRQGH